MIEVSEALLIGVATYADKAALESNAENVKAALGEAASMMAGPPDRSIGTMVATAFPTPKVAVTSGCAGAVTGIAVQPGKWEQAEEEFASQIPSFETWPGIVSLSMVKVTEEQIMIVALYSSEEAMASNAERVKGALGSLAAIFAAPPDRSTGVVRLAFPE